MIHPAGPDLQSSVATELRRNARGRSPPHCHKRSCRIASHLYFARRRLRKLRAMRQDFNRRIQIILVEFTLRPVEVIARRVAVLILEWHRTLKKRLCPNTFHEMGIGFDPHVVSIVTYLRRVICQALLVLGAAVRLGIAVCRFLCLNAGKKKAETLRIQRAWAEDTVRLACLWITVRASISLYVGPWYIGAFLPGFARISDVLAWRVAWGKAKQAARVNEYYRVVYSVRI